ncbi:unnamed protein product [Hymenolepis diminuta]|uniref:Uncharacterized protein n=1 Tax=Hymenolepis diminuta TaxID=6216 RepID=A0A0R3SAY5_HYMDI|nr:unnamed protein product [Hymenolepis diminuta]
MLEFEEKPEGEEGEFLEVPANEEVFDGDNIHDEGGYGNQDHEEIQESDNEQCDEEYFGYEEQEDEINGQTPEAYNRNNDMEQE